MQPTAPPRRRDRMNLRLLLGSALVSVLAGCSMSAPTTPGPSAATVTASPLPRVSITATYADGLPMTVGGEHVWRPADILGALSVPRGDLLVAAWDFGGLAHSCPAEFPGNSNFWCPDFEGLAEVRGGPSVLALAWQHVPIRQAAALVVRVIVETPSSCISDPPGNCPGPMLDALAVLWAGAPD
jgi:hypothetical protein